MLHSLLSKGMPQSSCEGTVRILSIPGFIEACFFPSIGSLGRWQHALQCVCAFVSMTVFQPV